MDFLQGLLKKKKAKNLKNNKAKSLLKNISYDISFNF